MKPTLHLIVLGILILSALPLAGATPSTRQVTIQVGPDPALVVRHDGASMVAGPAAPATFAPLPSDTDQRFSFADPHVLCLEPASLRLYEGQSATCRIRLAIVPSAPVMVTIASSDPRVALDISELTFTPDDWGWRDVLVTAAQDDTTTLATATITVAVGSADDPGYRSAPSPMVAVTVVGETSAPARLRGVNLAGAEFGEGHLPGTFGVDYTYPGESDFQAAAAAGHGFVRLPVRWERLQPVLGEALDADEVSRLNQALDLAQATGLPVLVDVHNYGRYYGQVIGDPAVTIEAFADFWVKMALALRDKPSLWGYGLMNEPHDMNGSWPGAAQAAVNALRNIDKIHAVVVAGDGWSSAQHWCEVNQDLNVYDPSHNLHYEAHLYLDRDGSGRYAGSYDDEGATPTTGADRAAPFLAWLRERGATGIIGEINVPGDDPRWLDALASTLTTLAEAGVPYAGWAAGPWWPQDYVLNLNARSDGQPAPQVQTMDQVGYAAVVQVDDRPWVGPNESKEYTFRLGHMQGNDRQWTSSGLWVTLELWSQSMTNYAHNAFVVELRRGDQVVASHFHRYPSQSVWGSCPPAIATVQLPTSGLSVDDEVTLTVRDYRGDWRAYVVAVKVESLWWRDASPLGSNN